MSEFYNFKANATDGTPLNFSDLKGKVVLVVNVASKCGLTPQYEGLEDLYKQFSSQGLMILGFPSNEFAGQEPGTNEEIQNFCRMNYGVTFPIAQKTHVNGDEADPIYKWLKSHAPGPEGSAPIEWNFAKFLIDKSGRVAERIHPRTEPSELAPKIEALLKA